MAVIGVFAAVSMIMGDDLWAFVDPQPSPAVMADQAVSDEDAGEDLQEADGQTDGRAGNQAEDVERPDDWMDSFYVWVSAGGSRYHLTDSCSGMKNARTVSLAQAQTEGYTACKRCNPPD